MTEDDRRDLYASLLRGIANECQDRLCAADKQHAWGEWTRYALKPDIPLGWPDDGPVTDRAVTVRAERHCLNCGKEQHA